MNLTNNNIKTLLKLAHISQVKNKKKEKNQKEKPIFMHQKTNK